MEADEKLGISTLVGATLADVVEIDTKRKAELRRKYLMEFNDMNILMALTALVCGVGYMFAQWLGIV